MSTTHRYFAAPGSDVSDRDAEVIGQRITVLEEAGRATPEGLVEDARPADAPTHKYFEWDDAKAAQAHRVGQAKHYLSNIYVVRAAARAPIRADQLIRLEKPAPRPTARPATPTSTLLARARGELADWQRRYGALPEVQPAAAMVREALEALAAGLAARAEAETA